jgi:hypothetical protein
MQHTTRSRTEPDHARPSRRSFLDDIEIMHGPRGELGRYFLRLETMLAQYGLAARLGTLADVARTNVENRESWGQLVPMLVPAEHPVASGASLGLIVSDRKGQTVSTMAARLFDFTGSTLSREIDTLAFYFGPRASEMRGRVRSTITAPTACVLAEPALYLGGFWLHPRVRGRGLSSIVPHLMRYIALTTWDYRVEFSLGRNKFLRPDVSDTYQFAQMEPRFDFHQDGALVWDGVLLWSTRDQLLERLTAANAQWMMVADSANNPPPGAASGMRRRE